MQLQEITEYSAGGIVAYAGRILVIRHARGEWIMPKGHLEGDETSEEAAYREIMEETNLVCKLGKLIGITEYNFTRGDTLVHKQVTWYLAVPVDGITEARPLTTEGILQLVWLEPAEALERLTFPLDKEILSKALKDLAAV